MRKNKPTDKGNAVRSVTAKIGLAKTRHDQDALYEQAPLPYVTLDFHGVVCQMNLSCEKTLGVKRQHMIGVPFRLFVSDADRRAFSEHLARFRKNREATDELRIETRDGVIMHVELRTRLAIDDGAHALTAIIDLTAQKRLEAELHRVADAERVAREASRAKDEFIATLSHELRSPLTPVLAAVSSFASERLSIDEMKRVFEIIERNVLVEVKLIDDLLDVSRIAAGKMHLDMKPVDIHGVAFETVAMFEKDSSTHGLSMTTALEAKHHVVECDAGRIRQVFANLVNNAIKFTPRGGRITLRSWNNDDRIVVEVSDTGIGIEQPALSTIFKRFEQEDASPRQSGGGLGLGLAICKGIVDLHQGQITVHSRGRDQGARFLIELRTSNVAPAVAAPEERRTPSTIPPSRRRVLLVEDHEDITEVFAIVLEQAGYEVHTVATAEAALAVDIDGIDLVISDLGLPDLSGHELLRKLRANHDVRAIALSGYGSEADIRASREAGFLQHLTKPVETNVLLKAMELAFRQDRLSATAEKSPA